MTTIFTDKTDIASYISFQYDRLRELAVEINILQKLRSPEELEGIEHSIIGAVCWPVSDRWKKRRASFVSRYDSTKYDVYIFCMHETEKVYNDDYVTIERIWEFYQDAISDYHNLDGYGLYKKEDIKERIVQQSIHIFEAEFEIYALSECVDSDNQFYTVYSKMEEYIASMNVTDFTFTKEWYTRREYVAQQLDDLMDEMEINDELMVEIMIEIDNENKNKKRR